jgi:hypothetical protein
MGLEGANGGQGDQRRLYVAMEPEAARGPEKARR